MKLTKARQKETGAFYTPKLWADLAVKYLLQVCPFYQEFVFYDPAAGEGALLEALPADATKYGSTLEAEDVKILQSKGVNAWQFDFLQNPDLWECAPDELRQAHREQRLVVFTNPPFFKCPAASREWYARDTYPITGDATALFLLRIMYELQPVLTCTFSKMDIYQGTQLQRFREYFHPFERYISGFISPSKSWGLSGNFPIQFSIWV